MAQQHHKAVSTAVSGGTTGTAASQLTALFGANLDTNTGTAGVDISHGEAVAAVLSAAAAQTITAGTLLCYVCMPVDASPNGEPLTFRWMRYPTLDWTLVGGTRDEPSGDKVTPTGVGRIAWVLDSITFSGGATAQLTYSVRRRRG